ncbi:lumenal Hsp70 protein [Vanrija albida]|uniref:Lumenal Hsp70 protein n=1 Tax=Vanrija albida TaxID=181172 RepID=A0ABR3PTN4_9TREE
MRLTRSLLLIVALLLPAVQAALLAIDYGAEFTKLSLVKPGHPFDVLLDRDSKRKISSVVSWKRDERVFGQEAKMSSVRFPETNYPYVKHLLASESTPQLPIFPQPPVVNKDGALIFPHPKSPSHISPRPESHKEVWTPTALLAHQIAYYRGLAEEAAEESITQVVVTVPARWTQAQRRAYRDALELQGLTCLAMIGDGTGVGLNYAMTRTFPNYNVETGEGEREIHVVYDSGALSTSATVLSFYQTSYAPSPKSKMLINTTHIDVLGVGALDIGGLHLDIAVRDLIIDKFIAKTGRKEVKNDARAIAKFTKEAVRTKSILSANQEALISIESVYDDIDFRSSITRAELEKAFATEKKQFLTPLRDALKAAGVSFNDVKSVILFGGNTRVPFVQKAVKSSLPSEDLIAKNVNSDEAAVLGAAFYGAGLTRQFKMKQIEILERSVYDISIKGGEVVFPVGTKLGERKSLLLAPKDEITLEFTQSGEPISVATVLDIKDALANFTAPSPVVNVTLRLDARGLFSVANAALVSNETEAVANGGVAGALKGLFGKKEESTSEATETDAADADESAAAENKTETAPAKKPRVALKVREKAVGFKPLTKEEKRVTRERLSSIATFEAAMKARAEARNMLEGYLYRLQNLLSDDAENRALHEFAKPAERSTLSKLVEETFEWLHDHADDADVKTLLEKRTALETIESPIVVRFKEAQTRGPAIDNFQQAMFAGRHFLVEARKNRTAALEAVANAPADKPAAPPKFTEDELDEVKVMLKDYEVWMDGLMETQVQLEEDKTSDPVIFTAELDDRGKRLQAHVLQLESRRNPRAPRPPRPSSSTSAAASEETGKAEEKTEETTGEEKKDEKDKAGHDEL